MEDALTQRVLSDPRYEQLKSSRMRFGWQLTIAMMVVYFGFILLVAWGKGFLFTRLGEGVTTVGIPLGFGVIVFTIIITALYVQRANNIYDPLSEAIVKDALK